jgi:hypothetical protein
VLPFKSAKQAKAVLKFRKALLELSQKISERNEKIKEEGIIPVFDYLDPKNLPFSSRI